MVEKDPPSPAPVLPAEKARQGAKHNVVRYVLAISLALVIIAFVLSYVFTAP